MAEVEEQEEVEIVKGYTMTQFCDKMIDLFLNEKTKSKEWRKYLVFREEWKKYRNSFFSRCQRRAEMENEPTMKDKFASLGRRVKKVTPLSSSISMVLKFNVVCVMKESFVAKCNEKLKTKDWQ